MPLTWVTGAYGFIGRHLARLLKSQGHEVAGIGFGVWDSSEAKSWGLDHWVQGAVSSTNLNELRQISGRPDQLFHLAGGASVGVALQHPHEDFVRTVDSTAALLDWLRRESPQTPLVSVSSAAVYGASHPGLISEEDKLTPFSPYGTHKRIMEELCESYATNFGLKVIIPRLFSVYGPGLRKQLLWDLCSKLHQKGYVELGGNGDELRDWTHIHDVVTNLAQTPHWADESAPKLNLATGIATRVRDIAIFAAEAWDKQQTSRIRFRGTSRGGDPFSLVANITRMRDLNMENSIPVIQGVQEYVEWFRDANACS